MLSLSSYLQCTESRIAVLACVEQRDRSWLSLSRMRSSDSPASSYHSESIHRWNTADSFGMPSDRHRRHIAPEPARLQNKFPRKSCFKNMY